MSIRTTSARGAQSYFSGVYLLTFMTVIVVIIPTHPICPNRATTYLGAKGRLGSTNSRYGERSVNLAEEGAQRGWSIRGVDGLHADSSRAL
eukprot:scaffold215972_cov36-Tisochrysis_lutea.AAC.5